DAFGVLVRKVLMTSSSLSAAYQTEVRLRRPASSRSNSVGLNVPISMLISVAVVPTISGTLDEIAGAFGQLGPEGSTLPSATGRHTAGFSAWPALAIASISAVIGMSISLRASCAL